MRCPSCTGGKVVLFTSVEDCSHCQGGIKAPETNEHLIQKIGWPFTLIIQFKGAIKTRAEYEVVDERGLKCILQVYNGFTWSNCYPCIHGQYKLKGMLYRNKMEDRFEVRSRLDCGSICSLMFNLVKENRP